MHNASIPLCCLCNQQFNQSNHPRIMPSCDHSLCTNCLKNAIKNQLQIITCNLCGNQQQIIDSDLQYFPKNIALIKQLKESTSKKSITSSQVSNSMNFSQAKSSNILSTSLKQGLESFQSDLLKSDSSLISRKSSSITQQNQQNKLCTIHNKEMEIICLTDFTKLCALCAVFGAHKDHELKTIDETTKMLLSTTEQFDQIKKKKKQLQTKIKNSEFKSQIVEKISASKSKLSKQIKDQFTAIKQAITQAQKNANDDLNKRFKQVHDRINKLAKQESDFQGLFMTWSRSIELGLAETGRIDLSYQQKMKIYWENIMNSTKQGLFYLTQLQSYTEQKKRRLQSVPGLVTVNLSNNILRDIYNYISVKFDDSTLDKPYNDVLLTASRNGEQNAIRLQMEGRVNNYNQFSNSQFNNNIGQKSINNNTPFSNIKLSSVPNLSQNQSANQSKKPIQVEFSSSQNFLSPTKEKMLSPPSSSQISNHNIRRSPRQKSKSLPKPPHPNSMTNIPKVLVSPAKKQLTSTITNFQTTAQKKRLQTTVQGIVELFISDDKIDTLDLCSFQMPDHQIIATINYVTTKKKIKCLKLSHNKLTNDGFGQIISMLKYTTNINLSHNTLTQQILNTLIKQRQKLPSLRILNLSHNRVNQRKAKTYVDELKRQGIIVTL